MKKTDMVLYIIRLIVLVAYLWCILIGRMYETAVWFACAFLVLSVVQALSDLLLEWIERLKNSEKQYLREQKGSRALREMRRKTGEFDFPEMRHLQEKRTGGAGKQANGKKEQ